MPILNFTKCMAGDLSYASKTERYLPEKAARVWPTLFDQHLKAHGLPKSYKMYMAKMTKALDYYDQANRGKRWLVVKARVCEAEAATFLTNESEKIEKTCARISKFMGFSVKADECSVVEFYNYVDLMGEN